MKSAKHYKKIASNFWKDEIKGNLDKIDFLIKEASQMGSMETCCSLSEKNDFFVSCIFERLEQKGYNVEYDNGNLTIRWYARNCSNWDGW